MFKATGHGELAATVTSLLLLTNLHPVISSWYVALRALAAHRPRTLCTYSV